MRSVLQDRGFTVVVQNAETLQANAFLAQATGGVRVMVPASQLALALQAVADWHDGKFALADDAPEPPKPTVPALAAPIYGPDLAAFLSLLLTPVYGATLHWLNARVIGVPHLVRAATISWCLVVAVCLWAALQLAQSGGSPAGWGRFGVASALTTAAWYVFAGYSQSKYVATHYGSSYARKGQWLLALSVGLAMLAARRLSAFEAV